MSQLSDQERQELFLAIAPLTSAQREEAITRATEQIKSYVVRPERADYTDTVISEYPKWLRQAMLIALLCLLLASATPSFFRMVYAGATYFKGCIVIDDGTCVYDSQLEGERTGINDNVQAVLVGFSIFFMAEIMLVLVGISRQVLFKDNPTARQISLGVMGLAFSLSVVGNWTVANPHDLFGWLETITPPFATIAIAMILEGLILDNVRSKHADEIAYQGAMAEYRNLINNPKSHPRWQAVYFGQIKDMLERVNRSGRGASDRIQIMASLQPVHWQYLVSREHYLTTHGGDIVELAGGQVVGTALGDGRTAGRGGGVLSNSVKLDNEPRQIDGLDKTDNRQSIKRPSKAWDKAMQYLSDNPADMNLTTRELEVKIGVSRSTIANVIQSLRNEQ